MSNLKIVQNPSSKESAPKRINPWTLKYNLFEYTASRSCICQSEKISTVKFYKQRQSIVP